MENQELNQQQEKKLNGVQLMCIADKDISIGIHGALTDEQLIGFRTLLDSITNYIVDCVVKNKLPDES